MEDIAVKLQEVADRSMRNEGRIKKLEEENNVLHKLATSVAVMAEQMKTMNKSVAALTEDVEAIKEKPAKRWDTIVEKIILAVVTGAVGFVLAKIGL